MADTKKANKKFLNLTIQQLVASVILLVFTGVLGIIGTSAVKTMDDVQELKEWKASMTTRIDEGVIASLEDFKKDFEDYAQEQSAKMGMMDGQNRKLEAMVNKLNGIIEEMRR
jgi:hypothetical protein